MSSTKRKDKKGRLLRTGEQQRKDGRYLFSYTDLDGKKKYVYSWRLEETDTLPAGRKPCEALRTLEKQINRDLAEGIISNGGNMTVLGLVEKYLATKGNVKIKTKKNYEYVKNILRDDGFGARRIDTVKMSDAKTWFVSLQQEKNRSYSVIRQVQNIVSPAFKMGVNDDYIRKNPFAFPLGNVINDDKTVRQALTKEEMDSFLEFIKNDRTYRKYYDAVFILFNTGVRISELCAITFNDVNLDDRTLNINKQVYMFEGEYQVDVPKTGAGVRVIAISDDVCECFRRVMKAGIRPDTEPTVDGISGFLFLDKDGKVTVADHWEKRFKRMVKGYSSEAGALSKPLTPHVCRHTYATLKCMAGIQPKALQYLMGHSDIRTTLNIYAHVDMDHIRHEVDRIEQKKD